MQSGKIFRYLRTKDSMIKEKKNLSGMQKASENMEINETGEEGEGGIMQDFVGHIFWFSF